MEEELSKTPDLSREDHTGLSDRLGRGRPDVSRFARVRPAVIFIHAMRLQRSAIRSSSRNRPVLQARGHPYQIGRDRVQVGAHSERRTVDDRKSGSARACHRCEMFHRLHAVGRGFHALLKCLQELEQFASGAQGRHCSWRPIGPSAKGFIALYMSECSTSATFTPRITNHKYQVSAERRSDPPKNPFQRFPRKRPGKRKKNKRGEKMAALQRGAALEAQGGQPNSGLWLEGRGRSPLPPFHFAKLARLTCGFKHLGMWSAVRLTR